MPPIIPPPTRINVYIGTHGPECSVIPDYCTPIELGSDLRTEYKYPLRDNCEQDNISKKNPIWCELTLLYYIWKHDSSDITGLYHYRRIFSLSKKRIIKLLEKYDVIAADRYLGCTIEEFYKKWMNKGSFECAMQAIQKIHPDYYEDACKLMKSNKYYACNMFVAKRDWTQKYCEWLFPILDEIERSIKPEEVEPRYMGFVSEAICLVIYIEHNKQKVAGQNVCMLMDRPGLIANMMKTKLWCNDLTHKVKTELNKNKYKNVGN